MSLPAYKEPLFGPAAYLDWEAEQSEKHEYLNGEVFNMAGASEAHVTIALNVAMALRQHLRGSPCSVFISDMKLRVEQANAFFYPDVLVTCAEADRAHRLFKTAPCLLVEVLSPSTEHIDTREKLLAYRLLPSLREYLLLRQDSLQADLYQRAADGRWQHQRLTAPGDVLTLECLGANVTLSEIYVDLADLSVA